eukprot:CAMPEP_0170456660 /NCGR_PEP_ID=MMETSP0123-20130129/4219_1 /TAXON_ID=182087 /ORGANISM="Favella ehrenbergii, Strain Fehren 1" /LENGTH=35 /DNA_ID= /DNA_START= /DNA_END= /DNA_ORIENTATION=
MQGALLDDEEQKVEAPAAAGILAARQEAADIYQKA